jgi:hypothetical protein
MADPTRMLQLLLNLCTNAEHAMRQWQRFIGCGLFDSSEEGDLLEHIGTQLLARTWHTA